jgi:hypothetical protein
MAGLFARKAKKVENRGEKIIFKGCLVLLCIRAIKLQFLIKLQLQSFLLSFFLQYQLEYNQWKRINSK